jgi:hypothetical protein
MPTVVLIEKIIQKYIIDVPISYNLSRMVSALYNRRYLEFNELAWGYSSEFKPDWTQKMEKEIDQHIASAAKSLKHKFPEIQISVGKRFYDSNLHSFKIRYPAILTNMFHDINKSLPKEFSIY